MTPVVRVLDKEENAKKSIISFPMYYSTMLQILKILKFRGPFHQLCEQSNLALTLDAIVHIELPPNQHSSDLLRPGSHTVQSRIAEETPSRIIYGMTRLATEKKMQPNEQ